MRPAGHRLSRLHLAWIVSVEGCSNHLKRECDWPRLRSPTAPKPFVQNIWISIVFLVQASHIPFVVGQNHVFQSMWSSNGAKTSCFTALGVPTAPNHLFQSIWSPNCAKPCVANHLELTAFQTRTIWLTTGASTTNNRQFSLSVVNSSHLKGTLWGPYKVLIRR